MKKLQKLCGELPGGKFTFHDLRRTVITHLGELGVSEDVRFAVAGQLSANKLDRVYNKASHDEAKREALEKWAKVLTTN